MSTYLCPPGKIKESLTDPIPENKIGEKSDMISKKYTQNRNPLGSIKKSLPFFRFFSTIMGRGGKVLLNIVVNKYGDRDVQLFHNRGVINDGLQISRSCLKNMVSYNFDNVVCINSYYGFYLAIDTTHSNENIPNYETNKKYISKIGLLEYVDICEIYEFAGTHDAFVSKKIQCYISELKKYVANCKKVASCFS